MPNPGHVRGTHHLTLCVGGAQEDYDFHVRLLGLRSVKKTVLFDGELPVYHLYYGNYDAQESTLLTSFPYRQVGWMGKRGTNQAKSINLSIPPNSIGFWADRLTAAGVEHERLERFGTERLSFAHPCGIEYALVGDPQPDARAPYDGGPVGAEHGIRGAYGTTTVGPRDRPDGVLPHRGDERAVHRIRRPAPPVPDRRRPGVRPDARARRGARPAAGDVELRRGDDPSPRVRRVLGRESAGGQGPHRRARVHRHLGGQGPRLLLLDVLPQPRWSARGALLLDARRACWPTSPSRSSARTCASRPTGSTAARRSRGWSRSRPRRRSSARSTTPS